MTLDARDFGTPQMRRRFYALAVNRAKAGFTPRQAEEFLTQVLRTVEALKLKDLVPLEKWLLPRTSPILAQELRRLRENSEKRAVRGMAWKSKHIEALHSRGLTYNDLCVPKPTQNSVWFKTLTEREQQVIAFTCFVNPGCTSVDCSQTINRAPSGKDNVLNTLVLEQEGTVTE